MGIEPLHKTLKIEAAKVWFRIGSTTIRYVVKRITPLRKLAMLGISDMLLDNMVPCSPFNNNYGVNFLTKEDWFEKSAKISTGDKWFINGSVGQEGTSAAFR